MEKNQNRTETPDLSILPDRLYNYKSIFKKGIKNGKPEAEILEDVGTISLII